MHVCSYSNSEQPGLAHWLNTTCQQIRALHSAHKRAKPTNAGETETVEDSPPPESFRLDHTPVTPYSSSIREMLMTFGTATYKVGLKVHPNEQDPRVPIMCWGSCSCTIQSIGQSAPISYGLRIHV
ncbi:E3 ubiquitin-protein ligase UBR2-like [Ictalurus punctatus]|uniref:E3 ubiquitin-protein ligase UBR2-like n=1 Tax=Ictalurus punctatus TaxID=7998 RepID=A0A9F7R6Z0_ICTPU|nr:E3 ubiquitin-protein ligase UBR2-like [Ictalurus punctatus]XP_053534577.1 E3 ubiquitin-protein ligase UBR2-like [Ictalurus punctatus]XP_053534916.1 E3 ubiquitin-protein ligase UBR2-like [Ictalurus punctatus]